MHINCCKNCFLIVYLFYLSIYIFHIFSNILLRIVDSLQDQQVHHRLPAARSTLRKIAKLQYIRLEHIKYFLLTLPHVTGVIFHDTLISKGAMNASTTSNGAATNRIPGMPAILVAALRVRSVIDQKDHTEYQQNCNNFHFQVLKQYLLCSLGFGLYSQKLTKLSCNK